MNFNFKLTEGEWVKWNGEVEFLIRPFPNSKLAYKLGGGTLVGEHNYTVFKECVLDWKGVKNEKGEVIPCDDESKLKMFDLYSNVFEFVFNEQVKLKARYDEEVKN